MTKEKSAQPVLQTYVVRIYERSDQSCPATLAGVVERVAESRCYAFGNVQELGAILTQPPAKPAKRRKKQAAA